MSHMNHMFALQQSSQELRDQIRASVQDQIRAAQNGNPPRSVVIGPDGKTVTITNQGPEGVGTTALPTRLDIVNLDVPPRAAGVAIVFFITMAVIIIGLPFVRAIARAIDRRSQQPQVPAQVTQQLTQLTQAVDSIAIEVERISEGQRFTTRLLSEQQKASKQLPSA